MTRSNWRRASFFCLVLVVVSVAETAGAPVATVQGVTLYGDLTKADDFLNGVEWQASVGSIDASVASNTSVFSNSDVKVTVDDTLTIWKNVTDYGSLASAGTSILSGIASIKSSPKNQDNGWAMTAVVASGVSLVAPFISQFLNSSIGQRTNSIITSFAVARQAYEDLKTRQETYAVLTVRLNKAEAGISDLIKDNSPYVVAVSNAGLPGVTVVSLDLSNQECVSKISQSASDLVDASKAMYEQLTQLETFVTHYKKIVNDSLVNIASVSSTDRKAAVDEWDNILSKIGTAKETYENNATKYLDKLENDLIAASIKVNVGPVTAGTPVAPPEGAAKEPVANLGAATYRATKFGNVHFWVDDSTKEILGQKGVTLDTLQKLINGGQIKDK